MKIGFVGVGAIGLPMAARLLPDHDLTVFDLDPDRVAHLVGLGASPARTAAETATGADATIVMVATPPQLDQALFGADGVVEGARPGSIVVVMSSVGVDAARSASAALAERGLRTLDAPVTGGVIRARTGELTILLGGAAREIEEVRPMLGLLGTSLRTCGPRVGDGQAVKVVNQHLCSVHLVAAGEALHLAEALDLDPAVVLDIVGTGAASSFMLLDRGPRMLREHPPVLSAIDIFVKDSQLAQEAGRRTGTRTPVLDAAAAEFARASAAGLGRADDSAVFRMYSEPAAPSAAPLAP